MLQRILVPLDGSRLSEASLPAAAAMAGRFDSQITLLHVIERDAPDEVHHERHLTTAQEAQAYLTDVAARAFSKGTTVETHVHDVPVSDVARSIVEHAAEIHADLIVTCTHGQSGVRDLLVGTIAQRVVALGQCPLLLIKPDHPLSEIRRILVPLDPDSEHDAGLEPAVAIAQAFRAGLELLSVVPTIGTLTGEEAATSSLMPAAATALLELREERAAEHLEQHVQSLQEQGLLAAALVARGDPASRIVETAQQIDADMIVLSTHRKTGLQAFWSKSVAPRVAQATRKPLLLVPLR